MRRTWLVMAAVFIASLLVHAAQARAEERASTKDAERMVHTTIDFMKKNGKEKTLAAVNDPKGPFTYRDLYMMIYDTKGTCLAHGTKRDRVGKNMMGDKDADGKLFIKERIDIAAKHGKGWQEYKFINPVNQKVEQKAVYIELYDGMVVTCGAYKS
jgi:cytochrome c